MPFDEVVLVADRLAFELVEDGALTREQFRRFMFTNLAELHTANDPDFFQGTPWYVVVARA